MKKEMHPYVLTLTIMDAETMPQGQITKSSKMLWCIRNNSVNQTHPDVVSVPTQRIPSSLAEAIMSTGKPNGKHGDTALVKQSSVSNTKLKGHDPIIFAVESLLSRKLGLSDELEREEIEFEAALNGLHIGTAKYHNLGTEEELQMVNIVVSIKKGAEKIPKSTTSFDDIAWSKVEDFLAMWKHKEVSLLGIDGARGFGICVDGLCILSTYDILKSKTSELPPN